MRGEIELKPCPFCGGEAALRNFERVSWYVVCKNCDARIDSDASRDEAIDMWTRRASEPGTSVVRWTRYDGTPEMFELLDKLRNDPYGLMLLPSLSEHACEGMIRDTWIPKIDAVLAKVKGEGVNNGNV